LVQYFVPFITTHLGPTRCWSGKIFDTWLFISTFPHTGKRNTVLWMLCSTDFVVHGKLASYN
jgi:hypothetical protein